MFNVLRDDYYTFLFSFFAVCAPRARAHRLGPLGSARDFIHFNVLKKSKYALCISNSFFSVFGGDYFSILGDVYSINAVLCACCDLERDFKQALLKTRR